MRASPAITSSLVATEQRRQELRQAARVPGVDIDLDAHPGAQWRAALVACVDAHAHRDALDDLDPVAAGVLRRQQLRTPAPPPG